MAKGLGWDPSQPIDSQQGFQELGLDSLSAVELRNRLQTGLACSLSATLIFDYPTVTELVDYLIQEVLDLEFSAQPDEEAQDTDEFTPLSADLEKLSQAEMADLLAQKLASLGQGGT